MTEQEAIGQFKERLAIEEFRQQIPEYYEAMELAVKSLEEIQQYRKLEERLNGISLEEVVDGFISAVEKGTKEGYEYGRILTNEDARDWEEYRAIGTPEECRAAVEKQTPKKVKIEQWIYTKCDCGYEFSKHHGDGYYSIPYERKTKYCPDCGQKLDWSDEE